MNTPNTPSELLAMQQSQGLSPEACKAIDACVEEVASQHPEP